MTGSVLGKRWIWLWLVVIGVAAVLRLYGNDWDGFQLLHPDERFMVQVTQAISLPSNFSDFFSADRSTANPHNVGFGFYVYGTLPLFLTRLIVDQFGSNIALTGRILSALADLLTLLLVGFFSRRLWKNELSALISLSAYGLFVGAIQQSHFYTSDNFTVLFCTLFWMLAALWIFLLQSSAISISSLICAMGCGIALGCALACKISSAIFPLFALILLLFSLRRWDRRTCLWALLGGLLMLLSCLWTFRILQPYAFSSTNLLDFRLNEAWLADLRELARQSRGMFDYPPAWQWVGKPFYFAIRNLFLFGIGIPLTILLLLALVHSVRCVKRQSSLLIRTMLLFSVGFIVFQFLQFSRMMRYLLPLCPMLFVLIGAMGQFQKRWAHGLVAILLMMNAIWAFAFTAIYKQPHTRLQATEWIKENVPAAVQLNVDTADGNELIQVGTPSFVSLSALSPQTIFPFEYESGDQLQIVTLGKVRCLGEKPCSLSASICSSPACEDQGSQPSTQHIIPAGYDDSLTLVFDIMEKTETSGRLYLSVSLDSTDALVEISGESTAFLIHQDAPRYTMLSGFAPLLTAKSSDEYYISPEQNGLIQTLRIAKLLPRSSWQGEPDFLIRVRDYETGQLLESKLQSSTSLTIGEPSDVTFHLEERIPIQTGHTYGVQVLPLNEDITVSYLHQNMLNESSWDDSLPLASVALLPFDRTYGIYGNAGNLELFDREDILYKEKMVARIDAADLLIVSSNRIYDAAAPLSKRFPLLEPYYRELTACLPDRPFASCFDDLEVNRNDGALFNLAASFRSDPQIGSLKFPMRGEEALSVYDHPAVFLFQKSSAYDVKRLRNTLDSVSLSQISNENPVEYSLMGDSLNLMTEEQTILQQGGGTWSELFNRASLLNQSDVVCVLVWLASFWLLGLIFYPMTRKIFGQLHDHGYGISRFLGLLICGYFIWLSASLGVAYSKRLILLVFGFFALCNFVLYLRERQLIHQEVQQDMKRFLQAEIIFLACFAFFLIIRLGNPDLWHMYKGGEKPMDFSYFNAVLKSTNFPPYDPWFAGGYLNYYYYGFFLASVMVKLLGIIPASAYNLVLVIWYAFLGVAAFTMGVNLYRFAMNKDGEAGPTSVYAGIWSVVCVQVIGNLGTVKVLFDNLVKLGATGEIEGSHAFQKLIWAFSGLVNRISGTPFQMYKGDWYWLPSRAIPDSSITEFPFFTFLYGDPHAHLFALPITLMLIIWVLTLVIINQSQRPQSRTESFFSLGVGALLAGTLLPTNTWDAPTYFCLALLALLYVNWQQPVILLSDRSVLESRILSIVISAVSFCGLAFALFAPYLQSDFHQTGLMINTTELTPIWSYGMHWGLFLFLIISHFIIESYDWMRQTVMSDLRKTIAKYQTALSLFLLMVCAALVMMVVWKVKIAFIVIPLMCWALLLMLRSGLTVVRRLFYFLCGTALFITLFVEIVRISNDVGRMNTVFKFYNQAWILLALCAACALMFIYDRIQNSEQSTWRRSWSILFGLLSIAAVSYTIFASFDKITDRMSGIAPQSLDGMAYMQTSIYWVNDKTLDLSEDYRAIQWLQDNVVGSPVIVEGHMQEYSWGTRMTIYTGLPGVIGWNYHQRQQRPGMDSEVWNRVHRVGAFYNTTDKAETSSFLTDYNVRFIVVGQLEQALYPQEGLSKFADWDGTLWQRVYQDGATAIYEVKDVAEW